MPNPRRGRTRVVWTDAEKKAVVAKAAQIQRERPDLAGLSLLRATIKTLPEDRRRRLITLSQVPWFEPWLQAQVQLEARDLARNDLDEIKDLLTEIRDLLAGDDEAPRKPGKPGSSNGPSASAQTSPLWGSY